MKALIVTDMLFDFIYGALKCERAKRIIPNIRRLIDKAHQEGWLVVYVNDTHDESDRELKIWGPHAMRGSDGDRVIEELKPTSKDKVIEKHFYSAFVETELNDYLKANNVDEIILVGVQAHICIINTAASAYNYGYKIKAPKNCIEAFDETNYNYAISYVKDYFMADTSEM